MYIMDSKVVTTIVTTKKGVTKMKNQIRDVIESIKQTDRANNSGKFQKYNILKAVKTAFCLFLRERHERGLFD